MIKLDATRLSALGAPVKGGAAQIEDWLRHLLRPGTVRLESGLTEFRGSQPVVTTLGDLKKACGVAVETVKQGIRPLEMDHWIMLVDGAHTRLLGPPRFRVSVTKENLWGSMSRAVEVTVTDLLSPLESLDYDQLRQASNIADRKQILQINELGLNWIARIKLANGEIFELKPGTAFTLGAGSHLRESGHSAITQQDLPASFVGGREIRTGQAADLFLENDEPSALPADSLVHVERNSLVRLDDGSTGILEVSSEAKLSDGEALDWGDDNHWLSRFRSGLPLVLVRRAIFAELTDIVDETNAGTGPGPINPWRIMLGFHDCVLDGTIPFRAGKTSLHKSPAHLTQFLKQLEPNESLRHKMARQYGFHVGAADVRISPVTFATVYEKKILQTIGANPAVNTELLSLSGRIPCWSQVGAYHRQGDVWPWEITREIYLTYVDVHYRQQIPGAGPKSGRA